VTIEALEREGLRGPSVANYIVATFKRMAAEGFNATDRLSRVGVHAETLEMARLEAETAVRRAEDAARPLPNPDLPTAFLAAFPPPPDPGAWPTAGGVKRPALKPRPEPRPQEGGPTRIGRVVDGDMMREERELADANEQWRRT
jgi:hypothetical protein